MKVLAVFIFAVLIICSVQAQADDCPKFCPAIYSPVCGYDSNGSCYRQFSNSCEMNASRCNGKGTFTSTALEECSKAGARTC